MFENADFAAKYRCANLREETTAFGFCSFRFCQFQSSHSILSDTFPVISRFKINSRRYTVDCYPVSVIQSPKMVKLLRLCILISGLKVTEYYTKKSI